MMRINGCQTLARLVAAAAVLLVQAAPATSAQPASKSIALDYTLSMFAIPFGHLAYSGSFGTDHYNGEMHFQTSGVAAMLWKSRIDTAARGRATPAALLPDVYTSESLSRRGTPQSVRVDYAGKGVPVMTAVPPIDLSHNPVADEQKRGAVDPVTGISSIVAGLSTPAEQPCGRTLAVFDGRRRYDVEFTLIKRTAAARVCEAEYRHISGIPQDTVAVSSVPAIYAVFVDISDGNSHYTAAQTIWSSFLWGAVQAKLTAVRIDGRPAAVGQ
jgi:hypothetical protein